MLTRVGRVARSSIIQGFLSISDVMCYTAPVFPPLVECSLKDVGAHLDESRCSPGDADMHGIDLLLTQRRKYSCWYSCCGRQSGWSMAHRRAGRLWRHDDEQTSIIVPGEEIVHCERNPRCVLVAQSLKYWNPAPRLLSSATEYREVLDFRQRI